MSSLRECLSHEHELLWCCSPTWDSSLKSAHSLRNLAAGWPMWGIPVLLQRGWKHWLELMTALRVNFDEKEGEIFQLIKNPPPINQLLTCAGYATPQPSPRWYQWQKCTRMQLHFVPQWSLNSLGSLWCLHADSTWALSSSCLWNVTKLNSPAHLPSFGESSVPFPKTQILKPVTSL